jgi:hypothetical protein
VQLGGKDPEHALFFPDLVFMEHDLVVTKVLELKHLQSGNHFLAVVAFVKNAERQNEDRILFVDGLHAVVAAFIDVNDVFPKVAAFVFAAYPGKFLGFGAAILAQGCEEWEFLIVFGFH